MICMYASMYVKLCALFIDALKDGFDNRNQKKEQNKIADICKNIWGQAQIGVL